MHLIAFILPICIYGYLKPLYHEIIVKEKGEMKLKILEKCNGFYGLIGPNIVRKETTSLYDFFMGNGMIQGVFIENEKLTFIQTDIETEKRKLEGSIFTNKHNFALSDLFGVANTAFLYFENNTYALFERDLPYKIDIDFNKKQVNTIGKHNIKDINHFSAHSKIRYINDYSCIETISYDILLKKVKVYQLDSHFRILSTMKIPVKYVPFVHDFISTPNSICFLNSPFKIDIHLFPCFSTKIQLDTTKSSIFYVVNRENNKIQRYYVNQCIHIFHYADIYETEKEIEIYASILETLDFSKIEIRSKYRKIIINKETKSVTIERNPELETMFLEFPVSFIQNNKKKVLLRYVENELNTGFIICHKLEMEKHIYFENRCICGEPSVLIIENEIPYAIFFTKDKNENGYFNILNLVTENNIEIPINEKIKIGFHSLFLPNCNS